MYCNFVIFILQAIKNNIANTELSTDPDRILCQQKVRMLYLHETLLNETHDICTTYTLCLYIASYIYILVGQIILESYTNCLLHFRFAELSQILCITLSLNQVTQTCKIDLSQFYGFLVLDNYKKDPM